MELIKKISAMPRGGAEAAHQAHTLKVAGSNPAPAMIVSLPRRRSTGKSTVTKSSLTRAGAGKHRQSSLEL